MSFIEVAMGDVTEKEMAPEGRYDLAVVSAKVGDTKAGDRKKLSVVFVIQGDNQFEPIFETFVFPKKADWDENDGQTAELFVMQLKRFMHMFGLAWEASGFEVDQVSGAVCESVLVKQEAGQDGVDRNKIVYDRLPAGM